MIPKYKVGQKLKINTGLLKEKILEYEWIFEQISGYVTIKEYGIGDYTGTERIYYWVYGTPHSYPEDCLIPLRKNKLERILDKK